MRNLSLVLQTQKHIRRKVLFLFITSCMLTHIVLSSADESVTASTSTSINSPSTSQSQSDCDKSMVHIANVLFGFISGDAALKVIREAVTMCPSKLDHRFTLVDHLLTQAPSSTDVEENLNAASGELQTAMRMIVESSMIAGADVKKHHQEFNVVLTRWNRLDKVRGEIAAVKSQAAAAGPVSADHPQAKGGDVSSTASATNASTQRNTNTFMSALLKELNAGASNDLSNVEKLPESLRLLWPLPFQHYLAQRLVPFNSHLIALAEKLRQQTNDGPTARRRTRPSALKKGYSLIDTSINPTTAGEPTKPCESQYALYSQFCESFVAEVTRVLRSPITIGDQKGSLTDIHVELLRNPSLQLDETLDAHRPTHEGVWSNGDGQSAGGFSFSSISSSKLSTCENKDETDCWSPPYLFTALYIISRPNDGLHPLAKDLTIDDELSFADPRVQAGMLSFASSSLSGTSPVSGSFLSQGEPLRYSLAEGQLFLFPSWISRSLAPNTSGRPRIFSTMQMAVRFKYPTSVAANSDSQPPNRQTQRSNPNIFFRWATPVYRSLLYQQSAATDPSLLRFAPTNFATFNEQLRQGLLHQREYDLSRKNWKIKSNRGGWHSSIDLLSNTPTLSPTTDSPALQQALLQLKQIILAHVVAYLRDVGEAACHPFMFHSSHDTCRAFPWRKLFQTKPTATAADSKKPKAPPPAGLGFLFGGGGGSAPPLDYHHLEEFIDITQSWSVINLPGHYNMMHTHPDSIISGVYYVSLGRSGNTVGSDQGTNVHFRNPLASMRSLYSSNIRLPREWIEPFTTSAANEFTVDSASGDAHNDVFEVVQEGKLLMFPAWLEHYVIPHQSEQQAAAKARSPPSEGKCSSGNDDDALTHECDAAKLEEQPVKEVSIDEVARICIAFNVHFK